MKATGLSRSIRCGFRLAVLALLLHGAVIGPAGADAPAPGEYVTERGWGTLQVSSPAGGSTTFTIISVGSNMHSCELGGEIVGGRASLEAEDGKRCVVDFAPKSDGIEVTSNDACRYYCGARAAFEGLYLKAPDGCTGRAQAETRKGFKRLYDKKNYRDARATLEPLLARCGRILGWLDAGWIRNDLALTQHKLGDDSGCRRTLEPLAADATKSDDDIASEYPPSDADAYLPIVKATRTNLELCTAATGR
jgi:hypothetical protein